MSYEKILESLCVISNTCNEAGECEQCPLGILHGEDWMCGVMEGCPGEWEFNDAPAFWRAFNK